MHLKKNIIRIFVSFVLIIGTLCSIVSSALAADIPTNQIDIYVNGKLIEKYYDNMRPFIDNNSRTQVPLRTLAEAMGFEVIWEGKTSKITIPTENGNVVLQIGSNKVQTPDGTISMDTAAVIINGRTYVPIRFVSEALGWTVGYKQNRDNSKKPNTVTHIITVDKITNETGSNGNAKEQDGIMIEGVREYTGDIDFRNNKYLVEFMKNNFPEESYHIAKGGLSYSPFNDVNNGLGSPMILSAPDRDQGYWYIKIAGFGEGEERPVVLAILKTLTSDAEAIFNAFEKMWEDPISLEECKVKYRFGQWQTIGQTNYMFDTTLSGIPLLKIKY